MVSFLSLIGLSLYTILCSSFWWTERQLNVCKILLVNTCISNCWHLDFFGEEVARSHILYGCYFPLEDKQHPNFTKCGSLIELHSFHVHCENVNICWIGLSAWCTWLHALTCLRVYLFLFWEFVSFLIDKNLEVASGTPW